MAAPLPPSDTWQNMFECPICYLLMSPPGRVPMILNCGHTLCEECLFRMERHQCPLCNVPYSKFTHNILVSQCIEKFLSENEVDEDSNPPSMKKDRPCVCSVVTHGLTYFSQRWYHCVTCGLTGHTGCCEACALSCHKDHNCTYERVTNAYCDCGSGDGPRPCRCREAADVSLLCTFVKTGRDYALQKWYRCRTCRLVDGKGCCERCAKTCHRGHDLTGPEIMRAFCDCGAGDCPIPCTCLKPPESAPAPAQVVPPPRTREEFCTFSTTRRQGIRQRMYHCRTCGIVGTKTCCELCATRCHVGHDCFFYRATLGHCHCGSGEVSAAGRCLCMPP